LPVLDETSDAVLFNANFYRDFAAYR
jgi:hypothetical protein